MWNGDPVGAPVIGLSLVVISSYLGNLGNMEAAEVQSGEFLSLKCFVSDYCYFLLDPDVPVFGLVWFVIS